MATVVRNMRESTADVTIINMENIDGVSGCVIFKTLPRKINLGEITLCTIFIRERTSFSFAVNSNLE